MYYLRSNGPVTSERDLAHTHSGIANLVKALVNGVDPYTIVILVGSLVITVLLLTGVLGQLRWLMVPVMVIMVGVSVGLCPHGQGHLSSITGCRGRKENMYSRYALA